MGVWIETFDLSSKKLFTASHPTWVCGLKQAKPLVVSEGNLVTPYVGVWIETIKEENNFVEFKVTPYVGVWIETVMITVLVILLFIVTPYVGVWIETYTPELVEGNPWSHPTWVCGLKRTLLVCYAHL